MGAGRVITSETLSWFYTDTYLPQQCCDFFSRTRPQVCAPDGRKGNEEDMVLNLSDRESKLLNTAVICEINHCQTMADDFKKEMEGPDCLEYLDCLADLEKDWIRKKKEYERLHAKIKMRAEWKALEDFCSEKAGVFRKLGNSAERYLLHIGGSIKETFSKLEDSLIRRK